MESNLICHINNSWRGEEGVWGEQQHNNNSNNYETKHPAAKNEEKFSRENWENFGTLITERKREEESELKLQN